MTSHEVPKYIGGGGGRFTLLIRRVMNSKGLYFQYRHIPLHSMSFLDILKVYTNHYNISLHWFRHMLTSSVDLQHVLPY